MALSPTNLKRPPRFLMPEFPISRVPPPSATLANWSWERSAASPWPECKAASISTKATPQNKLRFPVRVFQRMGVKAIIVTNAAGGINLSYSEGALVALRDHINLQGANPLIGPNDDRFGPRFPDMTHAYDPEFRRFVADAGRQLSLNLHEGVYLALAGPNYETPAEIHSFRTLGADLVGMSTVPEVLAARHSGIRVLGISCVTNMAAGITGKSLTAEEVFETGNRVKHQFISLLRAIIPKISASL